MRKILKLMFSQVTIVSILLILQLIAIAGSLLRISEYFVYLNIILRFISAVTVIAIINRHSNPSYKLAWVIPILIFPLFGGLFYLFITGQMHTKYYFYKLLKAQEEINGDYKQKEDVISEIKQYFPERKSTVSFINNVSGMNAYNCKDAEYFTVGEDMKESLLSELCKAKKYIFLEFFIIKEGIFWDSVLEILKKKAAEGLDVRVMYDGMGSLVPLPFKYPKTLESFGIKCRIFSPFTPFLSALQNNRDHRKIAVIDGKVAYTGGINLSDEYINVNYPNGHWKDMAVKVTGEAAFSFARMFLHLWCHNSRTHENIKDFEPQFSKEESPSPNDGFVMPFHDIPQDKYQVGEFIYLDIINKAQKYIYITTPYLILDHEMTVALKNVAYSGIDVKIICPRIADHWYARAVAYSYYKELTDAGIKLYEYTPGFIHGKTFVSDDNVAVVGSINLDYRSLYLHFECGSVLVDMPAVSEIKNDFIKTLEKSREITLKETRTSVFRKLYRYFLRVISTVM